MAQIGVVFRNVTMRFGVQRSTSEHITKLNEQLAPHGASLTYNGSAYKLFLCPGHSIVITQAHANKKLRPELVHDNGSVFYYLNVQIFTPSCDDAFGGALGQTYKCMFVEQHEAFQFDHATEESFRVDSITSTSDAFDAHTPCAAVQAKSKTIVGRSR